MAVHAVTVLFATASAIELVFGVCLASYNSLAGTFLFLVPYNMIVILLLLAPDRLESKT